MNEYHLCEEEATVLEEKTGRSGPIVHYQSVYTGHIHMVERRVRCSWTSFNAVMDPDGQRAFFRIVRRPLN